MPTGIINYFTDFIKGFRIKNKIRFITYGKFISKIKGLIIIFLFIWFSSFEYAQNTTNQSAYVQSSGFQIKGKVLNRDTKDIITTGFAFLKKGTNMIDNIQLENDGSFLFEDLGKEAYTVEIRCVGFYVESREIMLQKNQNLTFYLTPQSSAFLGEVEVVGEKDKGSVSKNVIDKETQEKVDTSITGDPVSTLLQMPGVQQANTRTAGGGSFGGNRDFSGISVRGGTGLENMALMDGTLIDHPYHTLFPDSVFIEDMVKEMTLYKGVIPPQYGQAMFQPAGCKPYRR